jgi:hypothetical protein
MPKESSDEEPSSLADVLDQLVFACNASHGGRVSVADVQEVIGKRSFGPMLLVPGLIGLSPIGAIPGLPGVMAVVELFFACQILLGRRHPWLPEIIARRSVSTARLDRAIAAIRPSARWVDRHLLRPRFSVLTRGPFFIVIALMCVFLSLIMPIIEVVPLAGIAPNAALTAFGLAVTAQDGLWALVAFISTVASVWLLAMMFF